MNTYSCLLVGLATIFIYCLFPITVAPSVPTVTFSQSMAELGQQLELVCTARGGPNNVLQWFRDGTLLTNSQGDLTIDIDTSQNTGISSTITFVSLSASDHGIYTCNVTNEAGSAISAAPLVGKLRKWIVLQATSL